MSIFKFKKLFQFHDHVTDICEEQHQAGTGFMQCLSDAIRELEKQGYSENLVAQNDHFCCQCGDVKLYPKEIYIDDMLRFENSSDPDDQAILYAISCDDKNIKGLFVESYGVYHDDLSQAMIERIKHCRANPKQIKEQPAVQKSVATRLRDLIDHSLN